DDLPPRNWRQWWRQTPSGFRIGVWGFLTLVGLHVALAVRIAMGLIEPAEVVWLAERGATVYYQAAYHVLQYGGRDWQVPYIIGEGLAGRSCGNVSNIFMSKATDDDLRFIGKYFPNVIQLSLNDAEITREGISALIGCRKLYSLELDRSLVDDD